MKKKGLAILVVIFFLFVVSAGIEISQNNPNDFNIDLVSEKLLSFLQLSDTPKNYAGSGGLCLKVNSGETAVTFEACNASAGVGDISAVLGDSYITNGSTSGEVNLRFNQTQLFLNISTIGVLVGFNNTFNTSYNNLLAQQCPIGQVVNGTLINGTLVCIAVSGGGISNASLQNTYLNLSGTNANQNINIDGFNFSSSQFGHFNSINSSIIFTQILNFTQANGTLARITNLFSTIANTTQLNATIIRALELNATTVNSSIITSTNTYTKFLNATQINSTRIQTGFINITTNLSIAACTETWNGSCLNTYCNNQLIQSIGCA